MLHQCVLSTSSKLIWLTLLESKYLNNFQLKFLWFWVELGLIQIYKQTSVRLLKIQLGLQDSSFAFIFHFSISFCLQNISQFYKMFIFACNFYAVFLIWGKLCTFQPIVRQISSLNMKNQCFICLPSIIKFGKAFKFFAGLSFVVKNGFLAFIGFLYLKKMNLLKIISIDYKTLNQSLMHGPLSVFLKAFDEPASILVTFLPFEALFFFSSEIRLTASMKSYTKC